MHRNARLILHVCVNVHISPACVIVCVFVHACGHVCTGMFDGCRGGGGM